jgi:hypothetical protein
VALYTIEAVVEPILAPDPPTALFIPTQGDSVEVYTLVEQLEIIALARPVHSGDRQLAHPDGGQEPGTQEPEQQ